MKILFIMFTVFFITPVLAVDAMNFKVVEQSFKNAEYPQLENYMETSLPGRCIHKFDEKKTKASAMLISFGKKGFEVAPIVLRDVRPDYFDNLNWADVFDAFPEVATMFLEIGDGDSRGLILKHKDFLGENYAIIRESEEFFFIKAFKSNNSYQYCYYQKP